MNPHDFLKLTPRNNCGQCGEATCLAFSVAVTKGGADPHRCPFVDAVKLSATAGTMARHTSQGLDRVAEGQHERDLALVAHLKSKIVGLDFSSLAPLLGADWRQDAPNALRFSYLGRQVVLEKERITMDGAGLVDPRDQILLYNYVASQGGPPPDGTWIGMESLPNSISKVRTLATYCENPLASRFAGRPEVLALLLDRLDAAPGPVDATGDVSAVLPVLPQVPLFLLFWDQDPEEGFEARVKVLFDHHVLDFLDLESLVFTAERLADRLAELDRA